VQGNYVAWRDDSGRRPEIYVYKIKERETVRVTDDDRAQWAPIISGGFVYYLDTIDDAVDPKTGAWLRTEVFRYDIEQRTTEQVTATGSRKPQGLSVSGDWVVYEDVRPTTDAPLNVDIYAFNMKTNNEYRVTKNADSQEFPVVNRNFLIYIDYRFRYGGYTDVVLFDLSVFEE
jgi:Tol biopolymer transport system component